MAAALAVEEKMTGSAAEGTLSISGKGMNEMLQVRQKRSQNINNVIDVSGKTLRLFKADEDPVRSWPIISIDEANVLTEWQYGSLERKEALAALLSFFVKVCKCCTCTTCAPLVACFGQACMQLQALNGCIHAQATKEDRSAHAIRATSDYAFVAWLAKRESVCLALVAFHPRGTPQHERGVVVCALHLREPAGSQLLHKSSLCLLLMQHKLSSGESNFAEVSWQ